MSAHTDLLEATQIEAAHILGRANYDDADYFDPDEVMRTSDTLADFVAAQGDPDSVDQSTGHDVYIWRTTKNVRRPYWLLAVVDFGGYRFAAQC